MESSFLSRSSFLHPSKFSPLLVDDKTLVIKTSNLENAGNGLFVCIDVPKNALITEYVGNILSKEEADQLREYDLQLRQSGQYPRYATHIRSLGRHQKIKGLSDPVAAKGRGGASFTNDPRKRDLYNCKFVEIFDQVEARPRVWLKATKYIIVDDPKEGVELYVDYQGTFWGMEEGQLSDVVNKPLPAFFPEIDECEQYNVGK